MSNNNQKNQAAKAITALNETQIKEQRILFVRNQTEQNKLIRHLFASAVKIGIDTKDARVFSETFSYLQENLPRTSKLILAFAKRVCPFTWDKEKERYTYSEKRLAQKYEGMNSDMVFSTIYGTDLEGILPKEEKAKEERTITQKTADLEKLAKKFNDLAKEIELADSAKVAMLGLNTPIIARKNAFESQDDFNNHLLELSKHAFCPSTLQEILVKSLVKVTKDNSTLASVNNADSVLDNLKKSA